MSDQIAHLSKRFSTTWEITIMGALTVMDSFVLL